MLPMSSHPSRLWLAVACVLLAPMALAQDQADLFFDAVDVNIVNVEVIVTDDDGNPVHDLTREDFEIFEDGEAMEVSNFFAVRQGEVVPARTVPDWTEPSQPQAPKAQTQGLKLVILVDDYNLLPQNRNIILKKLATALERDLGPRDEVMLVRMNDAIETRHPFTSDASELIPVIEELAGNLGKFSQFDAEKRMFLNQLRTASVVPRSSGGDAPDPGLFEFAVQNARRLAFDARLLAERRYQRVRQSCAALEAFTDSLAGLPGRKALLYIGDGMPIRSGDALTQAWVSKFESWIFANDIQELLREIMSLNSLEFDASQTFDRLVAHASANRVAFYPISMSRRSNSAVSAANAGRDSGGSRLAQLNTESMSQESSLLQLAEGTGGIAMTNTANIGKLMQRLNGDFQAFYSLGYNSEKADDGEFHDIEVRVNRRDIQVRHLRGIREKDAYSQLQDLTLSTLHHTLGENPLEVRLAPGEPTKSGRNKFKVPVMIQVPFNKILLVPDAQHHKGRLSVCVVARNERGDVSKPQRIEVPIEIPNERLSEALASAAAYPMELEMKAGPQRLAVGVRDNVGRVDSTVELELVVGGSSGE